MPTMDDGIWQLEALSNSDFVNDKETRISVYGYIVFFVACQLHGRVKCEECGFVNHGGRICCSIRSGDRN